MTTNNSSRRLVELAFDNISAATQQQLAQSRAEAARLAPETTTFKVWLELIEYIKAWNSNPTHQYPLGRGSALQFFLTRQAELESSLPSTPE
jgi:hypothetical protein